MPAIPEINEQGLDQELVFSATRSSGPGGQNVNKVNTRVELRFNVNASRILDQGAKEKILQKMARYVSKEGILILTSQSERSQYTNRKKVTERFYKLIKQALTPVRKRRATRPSATSVEKRLEGKKLLAEKKARRRILE